MAQVQNVLIPKRDFWARKFLVWGLIGPFNPVFWALILAFDPGAAALSPIAFITIWPCSVGGAIGVLRLKRQPIGPDTLADFVWNWAVLTIPIYTLTLGFLLMARSLLEAGPHFEIAALFPLILGMIIVLGYAFFLGFVPAMGAALMAYWTVRYVLFAPSNPSVAKLLPSPVASSVR